METKNSGIILVRIERGKDEWQMCVCVLVGVVSEEIWNCPELKWAKGL